MMSDEGDRVTLAQPEHLDEDQGPKPQSQPDVVRDTWHDIVSELTRLVRAAGVAADQVDDLLQDVFLEAWRRRGQLSDHADLRRWFYRVTINRAILEHRRRNRWQRVRQRLIRLWPVAPPIHVVTRDEECECVRRALDELSPNLRFVLMLRYFSNMHSREIAQVLSIPDSTVRNRLRDARQRLADVLRRTGYGDE